MVNLGNLKVAAVGALSLAVFSSGSFASVNSTNSARIVYGVDDRLETYEASYMQRQLAKSTAAMISSVKLIDIGDHVLLPPATIKKDMNLCDGEKFAEQPSATSCSGFLVGPDLLVTAGHCVSTQKECDDISWVFDYKVKRSSKRADVLVPKKNIYKCKSVVDAKLEKIETGFRDYALIKLEKIVEGKKPLRFRSYGKVNKKDRVFVIGHPSGLPQKVTVNGEIETNLPEHHFETNLDTFGGNSGSAVFNEDTAYVEGILVRGAKDYAYNSDKGCYTVNTVEQDINGNPSLGESVSRITDIPTLRYRADLFRAIGNNNEELVLENLKKVADVNIYDNDMKTAIHYSLKARSAQMIKLLVANGVKVNTQDINGDTALHMAVKKNNLYLVRTLIASGADATIANSQGKLPRDYARFLSFRIKKALKIAAKK